VLALLMEHAGQVITREEFRHRLWGSEVFVDFENSLNTAVARLREALSDSADRPRYIESTPGPSPFHGFAVGAVSASPSEHKRWIMGRHRGLGAPSQTSSAAWLKGSFEYRPCRLE
jgi:hypothetical protein